MSALADRFAASVPARRLAALSILAFLLWALAPLVAAPFAGLFERSAALDADEALQGRLSRVQARRAGIARLAAGPDAPFLVAANAADAFDLLAARLEAAVPAGAMRIEASTALPREERPSAPVELSVSFTATEAGLRAVLADLETRPPFVALRELALKPMTDGAGTRLVSGSAVLSAVPFLRESAK